MKMFFCTYRTNYGLSVIVLSAVDRATAFNMCIGDGAWPDTLEVQEFIIPEESKILFHE